MDMHKKIKCACLCVCVCMQIHSQSDTLTQLEVLLTWRQAARNEMSGSTVEFSMKL